MNFFHSVRLKRYITSILLILTNTALAQDTTWYDAQWNPTAVDQASCFFTTPYPQKATPADRPAQADTLQTHLYVLKNNRRIPKIDFCYSEIPDSLFLHRRVKIYNIDQHYPTLNTTTPDIDWPGEEIRERSGAGFGSWKSPNQGDTLEIVWIFQSFPDPETRKKYPDRMYLLKHGEYYVAVSGKGLTMADKPAWIAPEHPEHLKHDGNSKHFILAPGLVAQKQLYGELNLLYTKIDCSPYFPCAIYGPFVGIESNFNRDWIYGAKAGYQFACAFLSIRASAVTYFDNAHTDLRLLPEIGISFFGIANLNYGYSIPMLEFESDKLSRHRLSLVVNPARELW
jgi:hypothetical protein